jgi:DNA-binding NarL/FixJ family response regulator
MQMLHVVQCPTCGKELFCSDCCRRLPTRGELVVVMELYKDGASNREIAERLGIAEGTVKAHMRSMMFKANVHSRAALVAHGYRQGWFNGQGT